MKIVVTFGPVFKTLTIDRKTRATDAFNGLHNPIEVANMKLRIRRDKIAFGSARSHRQTGEQSYFELKSGSHVGIELAREFREILRRMEPAMRSSLIRARVNENTVKQVITVMRKASRELKDPQRVFSPKVNELEVREGITGKIFSSTKGLTKPQAIRRIVAETVRSGGVSK